MSYELFADVIAIVGGLGIAAYIIVRIIVHIMDMEEEKNE